MKYCEDCIHFSFVQGKPDKYDYYECAKRHRMKFKSPSSYRDILDDEWGFYLPGCSDFKERREEDDSKDTGVQQPWVIYKK